MKNPVFRSRFVIYFLIGSIVATILVFLLFYGFAAANIFSNEEKVNQSKLEFTASKIEDFLNQHYKEVETIRNSVSTLRSEDEIKQFVEKWTKEPNDFLGIIVFNNDKFTYGNLKIKQVDINPEVLNKNKTMVFEKENKGTYDIFIITPSLVNKSKGYIVTQIKNNLIQELLDNQDKNATYAIYSAEAYQIIQVSNGSKVTKNDIALIRSQYQALNTPIIKYKDGEGISKVAVVKENLSSGWMIINIVPQRDFYKIGWLSIEGALGAMLLNILIFFGVIVLLGKVILKRLHKITRGVQAVENGDLGYRISFTSKDIFTELAEGFNNMVKKLKLNYDELQKQTEELYERNWEVEEANKELEDSYEKVQEAINQLNEAEEKYYILVKNIPEIVAVIELDGTITFVNDVVNDVLGYKKEELINKNIDVLIEPEFSKKFLGTINKRLTREDKSNAEFTMIRKDGKEITVEAKFTYHQHNGVVNGVQAIVRDITKSKKMQKEIIRRNEELLTIYNISKSLSSTIELDGVFSLIVSEVCKILNADMCVLRLFDLTGEKLTLKAYSGNFFDGVDDLNPFQELNVDVVYDVIKYKHIIQDENFEPDWIIDRINKSKPEKDRLTQVTLVPICAKDKILGLITVGSRNKIGEKRLGTLNSIANNAAVAIENATLYENSKKYFIKTIDALIAAVEAKDKYTEGHSQRVSKYANIIAENLEISKEKIEDLKIAGILHDIGKIGISDNILLKPGKLTNEEYEEIKQHPIISNKILYSVGLSETTMRAISCHHERYDGNGYPFGLAGDELTIESQIIAVADAFDAMTSNRSYRKALSVEDAIWELTKNKGTQFGPIVVDAMVSIFENNPEKLTAVFKETELAS